MNLVIICNDNPLKPDSGYQIPIYYRLKYYKFDKCLIVQNSVVGQEQFDKSNKFGKNIFLLKISIFNKTNKFLRFFKFLFFNKPYFATNNINGKSLKRVVSHVENFEPNLIYFEGEVFSTFHKYFHHNKIISINDSLALSYEEEFKHNINKNISLRVFKQLNYKRILKHEILNYSKFDECQVVSKFDASYLKRKNKTINITIQNIGVDFDYFSNDSLMSYEPNSYLIVGNLVGGNLSYTDSFIKNVWCHFVSRVTDAKLVIVSRTMPIESDLKYYKSLNIEILQNVDNLVDIYKKAFVVISPVLKSCGMQNKVLEGMSMSKLVVGYECSFIGFEFADNNIHYIGVNNALDFNNVLLALSKGKINFSKIGISARNLVIDNYNWGKIIKKSYLKNIEEYGCSN